MKPYNTRRIVELYQSGANPTEIGQIVGCDRTTVYSHLHKAGVELRDGRKALTGRPRQEFCNREVHPLMDEDGNDTEHVAYDKRGKRYCYTCARFRWVLRDELRKMGLVK